MAARLRQAKALRDTASDRISLLHNIAIQAEEDQGAHSHFKARYAELKTFYSDFNLQHSTIITALAANEEADLNAETLLRQEVDNKYFHIVSVYSDLFDTDSTSHSKNKGSNVKLPKLNIPVFSGDLKLWPTFFDLFKSLIDTNESLTKIEKFRYLMSSLSDDALILIKNIKLTEANYDLAFSKLIKHYQNTRALAIFYWEQVYNSQKLTAENPKYLRQLLALFFDNLEALKNLGLPVQEWDFVLFHLLSKKIDSETLQRFEQENATFSSEIPKYDDLYKFLEKQCDAYDSVVLIQPPKRNNSSKYQIKNVKPYNSACLANVTDLTKCVICKNNHSIYKCPDFCTKHPKERYEISKQYKWCTNCLGTKHTSKNCTSNGGCRICNKRHHTLLHFDQQPLVNSSMTAIDAPSSSNSTQISNLDPIDPKIASVFHTSVRSTNLLPTAQVEVLDCRGNFQKVRVLIDSCSQVSLITETCARRLGLPRCNTPMQIGGVEDIGTFSNKSISCILKPLNKSTPLFNLDAQIVSTICNNMPVQSFSVDTFPSISKLELADKMFNISSPIDMLLESDIFAKIFKPDDVQTAKGEPIAVNTLFGWILMGKINTANELLVSHSFLSSCLTSLDNTLQKFWELENIPRSLPISDDDKKCEIIFQKTHKRISTGRFSVALPFKTVDPFFGDTRIAALKRLKNMENRL